MKFFCNGLELSNATNIVSKALAVNKNIPILEGIKIEAKEKTITLTAYNQELFIEKTIPADVYIEGEVVVNGKFLNDYVNRLSSFDRIEIEKGEGNKVNIMFGKSNAEIIYYDIENYPTLGNYTNETSIKIKERDFKDIIEKVIYCVALNDNRLLLKSCNMEVIGDKLEAVCLDGYRVAVAQKELIAQSGNLKFIMLGKIIGDISKILTDSDDEIEICRHNNMIIIDLGHTKIKSTTVEGDYFNYRGNLPVVIHNEIIINKDELESCLQRAAVISRETSYHKAIFTIEDNVMNVFAESEKGKINENIECNCSGDKIRIGLNSKYVMDAISRIKEDFVKIEIDTAAKPILVKKIESDDYKCVILPLRLIG